MSAHNEPPELNAAKQIVTMQIFAFVFLWSLGWRDYEQLLFFPRFVMASLNGGYGLMIVRVAWWASRRGGDGEE